MPTKDTRDKLAHLQAEFDRVSAWRKRTMDYADSFPDGHPKRAAGLRDYAKLSDRFHQLEKRLGDVADQYIAEEDAEKEAKEQADAMGYSLPPYTVEGTQDETGEDRWFVANSDADWVEGPYPTREMAAAVADALTRQQARS
jgi:hypothetical protein